MEIIESEVALNQKRENLVFLFQNGINKEKKDNPSFIHHRINVDLDESLSFDMDETNKEKLKSLAQKATYQFHDYATDIIRWYCSN